MNRSVWLMVEELEPRLVPSAAYYVSPLGSDANNGNSPTTAWQTLNKVNQQVFGPGDTISLEGGASFNGGLNFNAQDAGTAAAPITVTSYGTGRATIKPGTGTGLYAYDTGGLSISNLNFAGAGMSTNTGVGIFFQNDLPNNVVLSHVYIDSVDVSNFGYYGINISARNGASGYADIRITNAQLHSNVLAGLQIVGPVWSSSLTNFSHVMQDVYIGHVQAYDNPGVVNNPASGHGIILGSVNRGTVERSLAHDNGVPGNGNSGIIVYNSNNAVVQFNESYQNHTGGPWDGDGFDFDWDVSNSVMQYNYAHNNDGAGFLVIGLDGYPVNTGNTIRYNISENDGRKNSYGSIFVSGKVYNAEIYNNTVYVSPPAGGTPPAVLLQNWSGAGLHFRNNIFQTTAGLPLINTWGTLSGTGLLFQDNDYYCTGAAFQIIYAGHTYKNLSQWRSGGQEWLNGKPVGYNVDPKLNNAGGGGTIGNADLLFTLSAYQLKSTSRLKDAGLNLRTLFNIDPGTHDFFAGPLPQGTGFSIGAAEA